MSSTAEIAKAGKKAGLQIWRIEKMELAPVPVTQYGNFYTGDSYIVMHTQASKGGNLTWNLHFWLGKESSQDERGAAAILTTQIDDSLGGGPIQYRELQDDESPTFMGYFKKGVKYQRGGCASGFKHARTNISDVKRLLHVKGRRSVRATEVEMSWKSFNQGDIFIVEVENDIYQWNGSMSNRYERLKACELVNNIKNEEKGGKGKITILDEGDAIPSKMMKALSGTPKDIGPEIKDDAPVKTQASNKPAELYRVSSDTGRLKVDKVATAPLQQGALDSGDCFILDNGVNNMIFVWKGKGASKDERSGAMSNALTFITDHNYSPRTKVQVMAEGSESILFTQFFQDWKKKDQSVGLGKKYTYSKVAKIDKVKFDVKALYEKPKFAAQHGMVDDGSGKVEVWRVEGNKLAEVKKEDYGKFFAGDCYLILYTYVPSGREEYIIYYWQGNDATKEEIAGSAFFATQLDDKHGQRPVQCRVVQGKEPKHMLSIFGHPLIIQKGGYSRQAGKNVGVSDTGLYQVRSTAAGGTKAIQVDTSASMLNSNDAFLLKVKSKSYVWAGLGASDIEIDAANYVAGVLGNGAKPTLVKEGQEPADFWSALGGKKEYASAPRMQEDFDANPPKLFAISNAKGNVMIEEIPGDFAQSDLEPDDVMMLDAWDQVFVWIGDGANAEERKEAPGLVQEYISKDPRGRDSNCPMISVKMNNEPVTFTGYFPSWDHKFFAGKKSYADRMKMLHS
ncbi:gelsolin-like [Clavelina lepadiformis]|uniref:Gelsolin-like domain-containing protein n=1 Tax=Clavelina lepadiformis TaxID=159417 RepID=A0ABP0F1S2_CLALP